MCKTLSYLNSTILSQKFLQFFLVSLQFCTSSGKAFQSMKPHASEMARIALRQSVAMWCHCMLRTFKKIETVFQLIAQCTTKCSHMVTKPQKGLTRFFIL